MKTQETNSGAHVGAEMKRESETEAVCQVCGQITTQDMLQNGVHYSANLCAMYRQNRGQANINPEV